MSGAMAVTIVLPTYLRQFAGGREIVELDGAPRTVRDALRALAARHPGVYDRMVTEQGELREHVNIFVGTESIRFTGGLETAVAEGTELFVAPAVSGG